VSLFEEVLEHAAEAGDVRAEVRRRIAFSRPSCSNAFSATIGGVAADSDVVDPADEVWDLMFHGIALPA
jgi:hypothetical protein